MESSHHPAAGGSSKPTRRQRRRAGVTTLAREMAEIWADLAPGCILALPEAPPGECPPWCDSRGHSPEDGHSGRTREIVLRAAPPVDMGGGVLLADTMHVDLSQQPGAAPVIAVGQPMHDVWLADMTPAEARRLGGMLIAAADDAEGFPAGLLAVLARAGAW